MKTCPITLLASVLACVGVLQVTAASAATEEMLYSFGFGQDGQNPQGALINLKGTLYGTSAGGGTYGWGTVFSITPSGTEKVLYSFGNGSDGQVPLSGVINLEGTLYGTTYSGGTYGWGTVFATTPSGAEKVLHSFGETQSDGVLPWGGLINVGATLYGTTVNGGPACANLGCGTVYSVTPKGIEKVI